MRIRFTIEFTRSPKPSVEAPDIYDLSAGQVESTAEHLPPGFMGQAPTSPWDHPKGRRNA